MASDGRGTSHRIGELALSERPRERLASLGPSALSTGELVALVWNSGGRGASALGLAQQVISGVGGLSELARADIAELTREPGIGPARAAQLVAAFELGRRSLAAPGPQAWVIHSPADVAAIGGCVRPPASWSRPRRDLP